MYFSGSKTQIIDEKTDNVIFFDSTDPTAEVRKHLKNHKGFSIQYALPIRKAMYQILREPPQFTKWKMNSHARATTAHLNAPFDAKHHSVSTIGKLTVAAQAFLCDKAPLSGKDVGECVDRLF